MIAVTFAAGIAAGMGVALLLARRTARRSERDRLAITQHLAFVRAMSR